MLLYIKAKAKNSFCLLLVLQRLTIQAPKGLTPLLNIQEPDILSNF